MFVLLMYRIFFLFVLSLALSRTVFWQSSARRRVGWIIFFIRFISVASKSLVTSENRKKKREIREYFELYDNPLTSFHKLALLKVDKVYDNCANFITFVITAWKVANWTSHWSHKNRTQVVSIRIQLSVDNHKSFSRSRENSLLI